ncbi:hypothetical protein AAZX31_02G119500 [Glycine max]
MLTKLTSSLLLFYFTYFLLTLNASLPNRKVASICNFFLAILLWLPSLEIEGHTGFIELLLYLPPHGCFASSFSPFISCRTSDHLKQRWWNDDYDVKRKSR